jgi:uncharacterized protein (DUF2235 family)
MSANLEAQLRPTTAATQARSNIPNNPMEHRAPVQTTHARNAFVLCFDGTGNKFSGTQSDSNILKLYRMLERSGDNQYHYYQPGIGTYVTKANGSMSRTSRFDRFQVVLAWLQCVLSTY